MITQLISCDVSPTPSCGRCSAFMDVKLGQGSSEKGKKKNKKFICPLFEFHAPVVDRHLHQVSFETADNPGCMFVRLEFSAARSWVLELEVCHGWPTLVCFTM